MSNLLACRLRSYGKYEEAAWSHLPSIGITHVEMPIPDPGLVEAARKRLADHGLTAISLQGQAEVSQPESVEELARQAAVCAEMGVRFLFLSVSTKGADRVLVTDRLRQAGEKAARYDVTIVLETHPDLMTNMDVGLETMAAVNHPNVRINFDTANLYYYNHDIDAVTELERALEYVGTVHLKDTDGKVESWNFPTLGTGVVDFLGIARTLNEHGFTGPFTMELEGTKGVERDEAQTKKYVADSATYARSLPGFA